MNNSPSLTTKITKINKESNSTNSNNALFIFAIVFIILVGAAIIVAIVHSLVISKPAVFSGSTAVISSSIIASSSAIASSSPPPPLAVIPLSNNLPNAQSTSVDILTSWVSTGNTISNFQVSFSVILNASEQTGSWYYRTMEFVNIVIDGISQTFTCSLPPCIRGPTPNPVVSSQNPGNQILSETMILTPSTPIVNALNKVININVLFNSVISTTGSYSFQTVINP